MSQLQSNTARDRSVPGQSESGSPQPDRLFKYALLAITLAALIPALVLGRSEFISYDGYWHLFIDTQNRWSLFLSEYKGDAHPILYHLVLRIVAVFGHSRLLYRSASIIPGAICVYLLGLVLARLCKSKIAALLAAAAYGFSMVMIEINIDVRSYPLALLFTILAFSYLVDFLLDLSPRSGRSFLLFSVATSLAIATEYYAIFFFLACLAILPLLLATNSAFRERFLQWERESRPTALAAALLPVLVIGFFYRTHIRFQPPTYGHVAEFYWSPGAPLGEFILRNLRADLNYLLPIQIPSTSALVAALVIFVPLLLYFGLFRRQSLRSMAAGLPGLLVLVLLAELICLALIGRYPFGGFDRQQSIFFPFLIMTAFILLDWAVAHLPADWIRGMVFAAIAVLIGANFSYDWHKTPRNSEELCTSEYKTFLSKVPPAQALYVDQFTLIGYYIQTHDWRWKFRTHFREPDRVDKYDLTSPSGQKLVLLRNITQWNFDLHKPEIYQVLARSLHDAQLTSVNMFLVKQVPGHADPAGIQAEKTQVQKMAGDAGLEVRSLYDENAQADISFVLAAPREATGTSTAQVPGANTSLTRRR
jgi:dolichyl-phosphate-mannose-protein mannosyltransferase